MSVWFWAVLIAVGIPTLFVASFPFHAAVALRRSRRLSTGRAAGSISVIVPVKGLDEGRTDALARMTAQRTDGPVEWVFCLEEESDPALPELRNLAARNPESVRILITGSCGDRLGKLHNLIEGVPAARGDWLVLIDSDTILPHARYLHAFTAPLHQRHVGLVTCFPAYRRAAGIPAFLLSSGINHDLLGYFALEAVWGGLKLANGSCMAIRRNVLERIGGFAPQSKCLLMDVILAQRVRRAGYLVVMHHEPVEVPCRTDTPRVWWNQAHRWQVGMAHVLSGPFYTWYVWMRTAFPVAIRHRRRARLHCGHQRREDPGVPCADGRAAVGGQVAGRWVRDARHLRGGRSPVRGHRGGGREDGDAVGRRLCRVRAAAGGVRRGHRLGVVVARLERKW